MANRIIYTHPVVNEYQKKGAKNNLRHVSHYCMPGLNIYTMNNISSKENATEFYTSPNRFTLPYPFVKPLETEYVETDVVLDLVHSKLQWKTDNEKLLKTSQNKLNIKSLKKMKNELESKNNLQTVAVPYILTRYCLSFMTDPDQYFDSINNWYFKNTLNNIKINGKQYLVCARGSKLDTLDIISMDDKCNNSMINEYKYFDSPICDITTLNSHGLLIRQKTKLSYFRCSSDSEISLKKNVIYDNKDIPLVDADGFSTNYCTVDVKNIIKIWKDQYCTQDKYFEGEFIQNDSFMHLSYLDNQNDIIGVVNRNKVFLIDSRMDISKPCTIYDPQAILEGCEEITTIRCSSFNAHSFYITTNHSVLTLDNRMGFLHKSSHMLTIPPSLITTHYFENSFEPNEMLIMGNQSSEFLVQQTFVSFEDNFLKSQTLASCIPHPLDLLCSNQHQGYSLHPKLNRRFSRPLTGVTVVGKTIENLQLFCINSIGDLFVQTINKKVPITKSNLLIDYEFYESSEDKKISPLMYSHLTDMSMLLKIKPSNNIEEKRGWGGLWKMSKEQMFSYMDHTAPLILSPWDLDDISEWEKEDEIFEKDADDDFEDNFVSKINYWFNKNDELLSDKDPASIDTSPNELLSQMDASSVSDNSSSGYSVEIKSENENEHL
ncbi:uncharacterized protein LOC126894885 [Daktulosphaira vitifoliae]|uniref:uncharacterized protein LOC126894885 n=1 Tax=Daktulosphaira vitifoliae TaxID=58002 RepID=UPI0021AA9FA1|nr:uncharacterized protein LOC126894885 [Daktulosphaira vitifoliae]